MPAHQLLFKEHACPLARHEQHQQQACRPTHTCGRDKDGHRQSNVYWICARGPFLKANCQLSNLNRPASLSMVRLMLQDWLVEVAMGAYATQTLAHATQTLTHATQTLTHATQTLTWWHATQTLTHARTSTHKHAQTKANTHVHRRMRTGTHAHAHAHTYAHARLRILTHTRSCTLPENGLLR